MKGAEVISRSEMPPPAPPKPVPKQTELDLHLTRCVQWKETRARLAALGIDVSNYRPPPRRHRSEMESTKPAAVTGEVTYGGPTLRRYFKTAVSVR